MTDTKQKLIQDTYAKVLNHLRNKVPEPDCFDLAQECVVAYYAKNDQAIQNHAKFLWGIVYNKVKQFYQSKSALLKASGAMEMIPVEVMATRLSSKIAARNDLESALQKLPRRLHQAFELRYVHELSLEECSEVMGCSLATVKRDIDRARQQLAERLGRSMAGDDATFAVVRSLA